ncbi:thiamine pyrophosphokinase [Chaetomium sp. MPI-SDFR-AT-0129]|nr:thiamine pyrophosphokinase [Chaetomium sp. MPI-SDFR-AT-0129]
MESVMTYWDPARILGRSAEHDGPRSDSDKFALVVLNQPLHHLKITRVLWDNAHVRVAADGGANALYEAAGKLGDSSFDGLAAIVGDLDSLTTETQSYYESRSAKSASDPLTQVIHEPDQESTDFFKAVAYVRKHYHHSSGNDDANPYRPLDIVAIGGLGGRVDQGLSQLHHLYLFQPSKREYADGRVYLFSGESLTFLLHPGEHRIRVRSPLQGGEKDVFGKHVGIVPIGTTSRITTRGLEWDVTDWETRFGGRISTSNHVLPETEVVEVQTTKEVLFTIALKQ